MWITTMIISMLAIWITQVAFKIYGMCWISYIAYSAVCLGITGWLIPLSYSLAGTFFHPYFLSIAVLTLLGFCGTLVVFGETVSLINIIGAIVTFLGAILIVL